MESQRALPQTDPRARSNHEARADRKLLLREFRALPLIEASSSTVLADLNYPARLPEHIFEEPGDKSWHASAPIYAPHSKTRG